MPADTGAEVEITFHAIAPGDGDQTPVDEAFKRKVMQSEEGNISAQYHLLGRT